MYADTGFYINFSDIIQEDLCNKLERASDNIDTLTFNRIVGIGFDNLTEFQKDKVRKAVCIHADFMEQYGEYVNMPLSGFSAGSISVNFNAQKINGITTTQNVIDLLIQTGLTCRRL